MQRLKNSLSLFAFFLGLGVLFFLVKARHQEILGVFLRLNWLQLVLIFIFPVTWYFLQSYAWWRVIKDDERQIGLWSIFLVKITGEAVNTITPLSIAGGDPYRIYLLQKKISGTASTASVIVDRTVHTIGIFMLLVLSLGLAWLKLPLPPAWHFVMPVILSIFLTLLLILMAGQRKGLFTTLGRLATKTGFQKKLFDRWQTKLAEIDVQIGAFYKKHPLHFFEILFLHFLSRVLGAVEIYLIASFLELPVGFDHALFLASLTVLINTVFVFIPGSLGVMEGGYGAMFYLLKMSEAHGVAIQLVRRLRTFFWVFLGLMAILIYKPKKLK